MAKAKGTARRRTSKKVGTGVRKSPGAGRTARRAVPRLGPAEASRIVKRAAARQKIVITLTESQFAELARNFSPAAGRPFDPRQPFQIDFQCGSVSKSRLPVASCAYWSDTCCV